VLHGARDVPRILVEEFGIAVDADTYPAEENEE
jgi:hypothetical protein